MFDDEKTRKLSIICSKGTLDMAYPGLVLANAALMEGIDVTIFFTFWGLDMITKKKMDHLKVSPIGNPSMGIPNAVAGLPGMTNLATTMMKREIEKLDFPEIDEFIEIVHDAGAKLYSCKMSMDMMHLEKEDLCEAVDDVVGAMEFMEMSENAQLLFI